METQERAAARKANPYVQDPNCNHIGPEGLAWVIDKDGDRVIGRCECYRRWKGQHGIQHHKTGARA